ncbi:MAG: hypothetical protein GY798_03880 [Hyphomicrobiales bacterium]|nr:hypothetical protein [Hyphomicrobiales bacterium]
MSNVTHGMNPDEVDDLAGVLENVAEHIDGVVSSLETKVHGTTWVGPDANMFKNDWWPGHRSHLTQVATDLRGFGQSARNNASAQREASQG